MNDSRQLEPSASAATTDTFYSGFWLRFAAKFIDSIIISIASFILFIPLVIFFGIKGGPKESALFGFAYFFIIILSHICAWLYYALMESSSKQGTLGKMAMGIIVTDIDGEKITFGRATGRYFAKFISYLTLYFGFIMAGFTKKKQALHDKMANTLVVSKKPGKGWIIFALIFALFMGIAILGILAAIAIPNFLKYQGKSRQSEAKICLREISTAQNTFYLNNNRYAASIEELGWKNTSTQARYTYSLESTVADPYTGSMSGFNAHAVGNIDSDPDKDIWSINESNELVNEEKDL